MITRVEALNYRCFQYVSQQLGSFHVLAGPNASGKSTFLDVIALVGDLVNKEFSEVVTARASDYRDLFWMGEGDRFEVAIEAQIPDQVRESSKYRSCDRCRYEVRIGNVQGSEEIGILGERLSVFRAQEGAHAGTQEGVQTFPRTHSPPPTISWAEGAATALVEKRAEGKDWFRAETDDFGSVYRLGPQKSALGSLPEDVDKFPASVWFKSFVREGIRTLTLNSRSMRLPCRPGVPRRLQGDGSNLPWVIDDFSRNAHREAYKRWIAHIRTALPITGVATVERPEDRHRYIVLKYENGLELPSWGVSDGTLRFLALTLLPYLPNMTGTYLIEEPENGIHPKGVEAVCQSLSSVYDGQVLLATHSPIFLTLSDPSDVLCFGINEQGAADVIEGSRHPRLREWRSAVSLGDLFASGVLG
jgi:predicted ATPase